MSGARRGPSARTAIEPFHVMEIVERAGRLERAGRSIAHLEVGQPSASPSEAIRRAVIDALDGGGQLGYTASLGRPDLREALAERYRRRDGVEIDPARIVLTTGASAATLLAMTASADTGERIGVVEPGYPCYSAIAIAAGYTPARIGVGPETRYAPTAELVAAAGPLAALLVAHPQNPTGTALSPERIAELLDATEASGCRLIVDEIYRDISFVGPLPTVAGTDRGEIVLSSFSKYFAMTGWRLGWMVLPPELTGAVDRLSQNLYLAPPTISQVAALAALDEERSGGDRASAEVDRYRANRDVLIELAGELGADEIAPADGAFYVYARLPDLTDAVGGSLALALRWLDDAGVGVAPGIDFDRKTGDRWVRFSAAASTAEVADAAHRLSSWNRGGP